LNTKVIGLVFTVLLVSFISVNHKFITIKVNELRYSMPEQLGLPKIDFPKDNAPNKAKMMLGRKLFMDRRLSHNDTISCGMCHVPEQGFTVNELATAVGIEGRSNRRNAPTILNVGYFSRLFHDGREDTLENQVIGPLLAINEMGNPSIGYVVNKIQKIPEYQQAFKEVFNETPSLENISKAIATYERMLVSGNSKFDRWFYRNESKLFNSSEELGFKVFIGKGKCSSCHTIGDDTALFTDNSFHNTGVGWKRNNSVESEQITVQLAPGNIVKVDRIILESSSEKVPNDVGKYEVSLDPEDRWLYKTPTLRNIAITAPYMHDGSLSTLKEVVDFYNQGGEDNPNKDKLITPLNLSDTEKKGLTDFLNTLTANNVNILVTEARNSYPNGVRN
jgi:cytochrome c peroxidase